MCIYNYKLNNLQFEDMGPFQKSTAPIEVCRNSTCPTYYLISVYKKRKTKGKQQGKNFNLQRKELYVVDHCILSIHV